MLSPGTLLHGRYRILKPLGAGGMGQVFEVNDETTPTDSLKILKISSRTLPDTEKFFRREAQVLKQSDHPGIPRMAPTDGYFCECLEENGEPIHCLVMEKVPGIDLLHWLSEPHHVLTETMALDWLKQMVEILAYLRERVVLHRDIKPANIMLRPDGKLVLIDFGIARAVTTTFQNKQKRDRTGTRIYSLGYAPPEQMDGRAVPQSDFFALGRTMMHLLSKTHPSELPTSSSSGQIRLDWGNHAAQISPRFVQLLDDLTAPFPAHRPQTTQEILRAIAQIEAEHSRFPHWSEVAKTFLWSSLIMAFWLGIRSLGLLQPAELWAYDLFMRLRPLEPPDDRITIITIDDEDIAWQNAQGMKMEEGRSLSDEALFQILNQLFSNSNSFSPRVVGLDIFQDYPSAAAYPHLANTLASNDRFFAICSHSDPSTGDAGIPNRSEVARQQIGFSDAANDTDGVLRRHLLFMEARERSPCLAEFSFSTLVALRYLHDEGITNSFPSSQTIEMHGTTFQPLQSRSGGYQKVDSMGGQVLLNYRALESPLDIAPSISLRSFLEGESDPNLLHGSIVLIGATALSGIDFHNTPIDQNRNQLVPGVFVQAHKISQIISAVLDQRPLLIASSEIHSVIWIAFWSFVYGIGFITFKNRKYIALFPLFFSVISVGVCFWIFITGFWFPIIPVLLVILTISLYLKPNSLTFRTIIKLLKPFHLFKL